MSRSDRKPDLLPNSKMENLSFTPNSFVFMIFMTVQNEQELQGLKQNICPFNSLDVYGETTAEAFNFRVYEWEFQCMWENYTTLFTLFSPTL